MCTVIGESTGAPVFIIGGSRTGSEMLKSLLRRNSEIDFVDEMFLLCPRWLHMDFRTTVKRHLGSLSEPDSAEKLTDLMLSQKLYGEFWRKIDKQYDRAFLHSALSRTDLSLQSIARTILETHAALNQKRVCGAKFPVHYSFAETLIRWFPDCRIIHTVRDPRAVYASQARKHLDIGGGRMKNGWIRLKHFTHIMIQTKWTSRVHNRLKSYEGYYVSKYEDLIHSPHASLEKLCQFLQIPVSEGMFTPGLQNSSFDEMRSENPQFNSASVDAWKNRLNNVSVQLINFIVDAELRNFGYK